MDRRSVGLRLAHKPDRSAMIDTFLLCFALVTVTAVCAVAARRLRVPYSIVLVNTGIALAFVPGLPNVQLDPHVVMLLFLPPLLYMAGVSMSWRGFRDNLRPIVLLAVGCVLFTACTVAAVAHWAMGLPWGVAFVLGAVVSPPDVLAPMAIARRLQVPMRILTILEGEGLVNDATALILFRFAVAAVGTGGFSIGHAASAFVLIVVGETLYGVLVGRLPWDLVSWRGDPRAPRCPMSRHQTDPLRPLTADERQELTRLSRSLSAPAGQVERARALLAIADGASYTAAAHRVGRRHTETISAWVSRFNRDGLAAVRPGHGGGARIRYGADAQQRILAEWARTPQREQDGTATWSLSLLQRALRQADDGLPQVSTFTIWRTLHEAGLSWQKSRTWCETGVAMRQRKHGVVRVSDPDALAKKS